MIMLLYKNFNLFDILLSFYIQFVKLKVKFVHFALKYFNIYF